MRSTHVGDHERVPRNVSQPLRWASVGFGLHSQVPAEVLFLQLAFGTAPLDLTHLVVCAAMASTVLRFDELRKVFLWHSLAD